MDKIIAIIVLFIILLMPVSFLAMIWVGFIIGIKMFLTLGCLLFIFCIIMAIKYKITGEKQA